jgi:hypothetical protein
MAALSTLPKTAHGDSGRQDRSKASSRVLRSTLFLTVLPFVLSNGWAAGAARSTVAKGSSSGRAVYVSPTGSDANPGTSALPFRTLIHARNAVRKLNKVRPGGITVYLESGTYRLKQTMDLGPRDSGTPEHDNVWTAAPGATAIISSAIQITGWQLTDPSMDIWAAPAPGLDTRQIYVNGERASMAAGLVPVALYATAAGYYAGSPLLSHWRNPNEMEFVYTGGRPIWNVSTYGLGPWTEPMCPISAIYGRHIRMAEPCWRNSTQRALYHGNTNRSADLVGLPSLDHYKVPAYMENAYELLKSPGQFYLDRHAGMLYYIPRPGQDMQTADVEAPVLQSLINGTGTPAAPIHNISLTNLQLSYATWLQPSSPEGFSEIQSGYTITGRRGAAVEGLCGFAPHGTCPYGSWTREPGNVQFRYDRNLSFIDDRFVHLGAAGLNLDDGTQNDLVQGSVFTDISGDGIELGSVDMPRARGPSQTLDNTIMDNHLYGLPVEYHGGVAVLVGYAAGTSIAHNQIDHTSYTAISIGWAGWPERIERPLPPTFVRDNSITDNLIFDTMQVVSDGGGIYVQGKMGPSLAHGLYVAGNVIHDQLDWGYALYTDDGAAFMTFDGNVCYNNNYDWGITHYDYTARNGMNDPQLIENNYWQQGDPDISLHRLVKSGNQIITGPGDAPSTIVDNAGIEPAYKSTLDWQPADVAVPNAPERVASYAGDGQAYVTWKPSYAEGSAPVTSYTVTSSGDQQATISVADLVRYGYVVVPGLTNGVRFTFSVTATSAVGTSIPSVPSPLVVPESGPVTLPVRPRSVQVRPGRGDVQLRWYQPVIDGGRPILGYVITSSTGDQFMATGYRQLIIAGAGGDTFHVFGGLKPEQTYSYTIAAFTSAGVGPATPSPSFTVSP